jgi:integrase
LTLASARALAVTALRELAQGHDPAAAKQAKKHSASEARTFADVVPLYVEHLKRDNRSWKQTADIVEGMATVIGKRSLESLDADTVWALIERAKLEGMPGRKVFKAGPSESRARLAHNVLQALFSWLVRNRLMAASPMAGIEPPRLPKARKRVLSDAEIAIFWQACDDVPSVWAGRALRLLACTGLRQREASEMSWHEIQGNLLVLPGSRTKNKHEHRFPLSSLALDVIASVPRVEGCPFVFSSGKVPVNSWEWTKDQLDAAMRRRGWNGEAWVIHDLRRTVATILARIGTPIHITEKLLNHTSGKLGGLVGVYQTYEYEPECRAAVEKLAEEIRRIVASAIAPAGDALAA